MYLLERLLEKKGPLSARKGGEKRWLQSRDDLLDMELVEMLELARAEGIIREGRILLLSHEIRWIRNAVVHDKLPLFKSFDERFYRMTVPKSRRGRIKYATIQLEKAEVAGLGSARPELTAYFCVSRTRMILRGLFGAKTTEAKAKNEGSGDLFLWQET